MYQKGRKHRKSIARERCAQDETENNHKVDSAGDNCCEGSQKADPDVAWSTQLWDKVLEITRQFLSWVLCRPSPPSLQILLNPHDLSLLSPL